MHVGMCKYMLQSRSRVHVCVHVHAYVCMHARQVTVKWPLLMYVCINMRPVSHCVCGLQMHALCMQAYLIVFVNPVSKAPQLLPRENKKTVSIKKKRLAIHCSGDYEATACLNYSCIAT